MDLLCRDTDLGAEAELAAVDKAGGGVQQHCRSIDLVQESLGGHHVVGDDGFGVT